MISLRKLFVLLVLVTPAIAGQEPYHVASGVFDAAKPDLGLKRAAGSETVTIFRPRAGAMQYNNGVVLMPFKGRLYAQWQSSARDEDAPDTFVVYASSADGKHWTMPVALVPRSRGLEMRTSGGWWSDGKTLVAYINVWPKGFDSAAGGYAEFKTSKDGVHWSKLRRVTGADGKPVEGVIEQDPHALPDGRIVAAFHMQPGLIAAPFYTDDSRGVSGWTRGAFHNLPHTGPQSRELEPGWFLRRDGCLVMVFRDQASSFRQLAAESCDRGATWTAPMLTDMPDSRAKQSAGNLPDGTTFLINAPSGNKTRVPLTVTLSKDGRMFDRAYLLRGAGDLPPLRYPGKYKRPGYHYPKSVIWNGRLYAAYATNKEDVEVTSVPLVSLK